MQTLNEPITSDRLSMGYSPIFIEFAMNLLFATALSLLRTTLPSIAREVYQICFTLFKLMIPVLIVVKVLEEFGAIPVIGRLLEPLMTFVGLPEAFGIVWASTLLTNIYGGMLLFFPLAAEHQLTVAQVTVLGGMMLMAHGLPVEVRIAQKAGVRLLAAFCIRFFGALLFGAFLHHTYLALDWLQEPVQLLWQPETQVLSLTGWAGQQIKGLLMIVVVVTALLTLLRFLRWIHVERLMIWLLQPVLRFLGIGKAATSMTIIGVTLGLSFGGGLLIQEAKTGHVPQKDVFSAMLLLGLCHSIIEDTLLIMLMGADLSGALWFRLLFALLMVAGINRALTLCSPAFWQRYLMKPAV